MVRDKRNFIITGRHKRLQRLWQFFFTGWGLIIVTLLVAAPFFTHNLLWTPIKSVDMAGIETNQFRMENASFVGIDNKGQPFTIKAHAARQEYEHPYKIFMTSIHGTVIRVENGVKITDNISANRGVMDRERNLITLYGNVQVDSNNVDKVRTKEMVIRL